MTLPDVRTDLTVVEIVALPQEPEAVETLVDRESLIAEMRRVAPPGQTELDEVTEARLSVLTTQLLCHDPEARQKVAAEYNRFLDVQERGLDLDTGRLREQLAGKTVLVTGGTGCIGTELLKQLPEFGPARIVSISRGETQPSEEVEGAEYVHVDIRDRESLITLFESVKPDIVYHLAAQHLPDVAEVEVSRTLSTNVTGTQNVIDAAEASGVETMVYASTGKAFRPVTPDIYAGSKKKGEWLMARAAQAGKMLCAGVRFTHVVNNSSIKERLDTWIAKREPIRLHGEAEFYLQSAREAAQLLLNAGLEAEDGVLTLQTICDL